MKKTDYQTFAEWICPYKKCGSENVIYDADMADNYAYEKTPVTCDSCGKESLLSGEY